MIKLTEQQIKFLVENEDRYTLKEFSRFFGYTCKEIYEVYDRITRTKEYRNYITNKVAIIAGKLRRGRVDNYVESTREDNEDEQRDRENELYFNARTHFDTDTIDNSVQDDD